MPVKCPVSIAIAIIHPNIGGWAGSYFSRKNIKPWYEVIKSINQYSLKIINNKFNKA